MKKDVKNRLTELKTKCHSCGENCFECLMFEDSLIENKIRAGISLETLNKIAEDQNVICLNCKNRKVGSLKKVKGNTKYNKLIEMRENNKCQCGESNPWNLIVVSDNLIVNKRHLDFVPIDYCLEMLKTCKVECLNCSRKRGLRPTTGKNKNSEG